MKRLLVTLCFIVQMPAVVHAATFVVDDLSSQSDTNPGDGECRSLEDTCTLSGAITEANALPGADRIEFSVAGTITESTFFPEITDSLVIDATTAPGYNSAATHLRDAEPVVVIESNPGFSGVLVIVAPDVSILALEIKSDANRGIIIDDSASNVWIDRCHIGPVPSFGIQIETSSNFIGQRLENNQVVGLGNVIGGTSLGIGINGENNTVAGNFIGVRADGRTIFANEFGILVNSSNTDVGFEFDSEFYGNVISGNTNGDISAIGVVDGLRAGTNIIGNYIGFSPNALSVQSMADTPLFISQPRAVVRGNRIGGALGSIFSVRESAVDILIEDNEFGARPAFAIPMGGTLMIEANGAQITNNQFAGSDLAAVDISGVTGFELADNRFGFIETFQGALSLPNFADLRISNSSFGTVSGNRFAFTDGGGAVSLNDVSTVVLSSNTFGLASRVDSGTGTGLFIASSVSDIDVEGNAFFYNDSAIVFSDSGTVAEGVMITSVEMRGNGTAVDLIDNLALANDIGDPDEGPNRLQNTPEVLSVSGTQSPYLLQYLVDSASEFSDYPITVEFYGASDDATPQGQTLLATGTYAAPGTVASLSVDTANFDGLVALATDASGNTSEFSDKVPLPAPPLIFMDRFELVP